MHRRKNVSLVFAEPLRAEAVARILNDHDFSLMQQVAAIDDLDHAAFADDEILLLDVCVLDKAGRADRIRCLLGAQPTLRIVVFANAQLASEVPALMALHIYGVILSTVCWQAMVTMLMTVTMGERVIPFEILSILSRRASRPDQHTVLEAMNRYGLSHRESVILSEIGRGMPDKAISSKIGVSESTVKASVKTLFRKLGVSNRTQAAIMTR